MPTATRTGYDFAGWFTAQTGGTAVSAKTVASANVTLYAHWTPIAYKIVYDLDGGSNAASNPATYTIEDAVTLAAPTRFGYTFIGWTPDEGKIAKGSTGPKEFKANWALAPDAVLLTVIFDGNGGTVNEKSRKVPQGGTVGNLPTVTRNGYVLAGWYTASSGGSKISGETVVSSASTFYAHWVPENYNIVYKLNGGVNAKQNPAKYTIEDAVTLAAPTRSGYTFVGWTPDGGKIAKGSIGDKTFTAQWKAGGGQKPEPDPQPGASEVSVKMPDGTVRKLKPGSSIMLPPAVEKAGFVFMGWSDGKKVYAAGSRYVIPAQGVTLTAVYGEFWLYDEDSIAVQSDETAPYASAAAVYDGYIVQDGVVKGTIQVKVSKGKVNKKTGLFAAKVTATVQLADGSKKLTFKGGVADEAGNVTGLTAAGHSLDITLGVNGLGGSLDGKAIDGSRNFFSAKDADAKAVAAATEANWLGAINIVTENAVLGVTIAKKGKVKVAGTVNGVKVTAKSQLLIGEESCCIPVVITKKANLAFNVWLGADGSVEVVGLAGVKAADKAGTLKAGAKFSLGAAADALAAKLPGLYRAYLPEGLAVAANGKKWVVADGAKAGKVAFAKGTTEIDETKLGANPSGLKLTYKAKDGSFKGSFKVYALVGGKIKAYTANVTGVMVGTTGYGTATVKGVGSVPVTIVP